jgi:plastocyanin
VTVSDNVFTPVCTKVAINATVTWNFTGSDQHNVTFTNSSLGASQTMSSGTYTKAFAAAGTYAYSCTRHPGMDGSVVVQ